MWWVRARATAWCRTSITVTLVSACSLELAPLEQPGVGASGGSSGVGGSGNGSGFGGTGGVFDAAGGTGAGGNGGSTGGAGGVGGSAGAGGTGGFPNSCAAFCDRVALAGCPEPSWQDCHDYCVGHFSWFDKCAVEYELFLQCGATAGTFVCNAGYYEQTNCLNEWEVFWDCTWDFVPLCNEPTGSSGGGCTQGSCDPVLDNCPNGYACSWVGSGDFQCFPGQYTEYVCESCFTYDCMGGFDCVGFTAQDAVCARYCCTDADCGGIPGSCIEVGYFSDTRFCGSK